MSFDSNNLLARWREVGAWWECEPVLDWATYLDAKGIRREVSRELPPVCVPDAYGDSLPNENREEIALRPRKLRDEKVAIACGYAPKDHVVRLRKDLVQSPPYVPLHIHSGYAFGRSLLFAREIPRRVASLGLPAAAIADPFSLTGAVEFVRECKASGIKALIGASFEMDTGGEIVLIARDKNGYQSLSQLITDCSLDEPRLFPLCTKERLEKHARGLILLSGGDNGPLNRLFAQKKIDAAYSLLDFWSNLYGTANVFIEIERSFLPWEIPVNKRLIEYAKKWGLHCIAGGPVTHASPSAFPAQDILVCSSTLCLVDEVIGRKPDRHPSQPRTPSTPHRALNAERYLRSRQEMHTLFSDAPYLMQNTLLVADRCDDDVMPARTRLPQIYENPGATLRQVVYAEADLRHSNLTSQLKSRLDHEIDRINRLNFADHFLLAWEVCRWATENQILFSGRGSVVDSAVAYCLGISRIDAFEHRLHFDRFLPEDGSKRPDIDIDFESRRRDDVRNHMIQRYGTERVATVAAVGAYCARGIIREVGKALAIPNETLGYLAKKMHGAVTPEQLRSALEKRPELRDAQVPIERFLWVFHLAKQLSDIPRNIRAHSSGVVVSARPISETVPVQWSGGQQDDGSCQEHLRIIQWDKRSAKYYFDKFDILCLRGQDVLGGTQERIRLAHSDFSVESISLEDEELYRTMRSGELIGIPQSASPAMRQAHMRLRTENLHDASLVQAGIRPGVGGAVKINELILRRRGLKAYGFEHPDLETILGHTYGIVVFQEQIDQLLQTFAGYSSGEAEDIREEIHKRRREDYGQVIREEMISKILDRGYSVSVAEQVFDYVAAFKGYGFAQGHALAFAEISLRSVHCQQTYPAEYFASLLDAQPAGYYGPCTLVNEARTRGVAILPVDINRSTERFEVEDVQSTMDPKIILPNAGIRVALSQIQGVSTATRSRIVSERTERVLFRSFFDFVQRVLPHRDELEQLVLCGAFDALFPNRRALIWSIPSALQYGSVNQKSADRLEYEVPEPLIDTTIPDFADAEKAIRERMVLGLDVSNHLMAFERSRVSARQGITCSQAKQLPDKTQAIVVGNPIRLRFPPTASGKRVVFFDLEDETGLLNVTCFDDTYQQDGHAIICSPYVTVVGQAQWRDGHTAFLGKRVFAYRPDITKMVEAMSELPVVSSDFLVG